MAMLMIQVVWKEMGIQLYINERVQRIFPSQLVRMAEDSVEVQQMKYIFEVPYGRIRDRSHWVIAESDAQDRSVVEVIVHSRK